MKLVEADFNTTDASLSPEEQKHQQHRKAFNARYEWAGVAFDGISNSRKDVWRTLCRRCEFPGIDECLPESKEGEEEAPMDVEKFMPAAKLLVFCCLADKEVMRNSRCGEAGMHRLMDAFDEWRDSTVTNENEIDCTLLGITILNDSVKNFAEAVASGDGAGK